MTTARDLVPAAVHGVAYDTGRPDKERFIWVADEDPREAARRLEEHVAEAGVEFDWSQVSWHAPPAATSAVWIGEGRAA